MLELRQLAYFLNIAEAGSLSQAALQLQVSQSIETVSLPCRSPWANASRNAFAAQ